MNAPSAIGKTGSSRIAWIVIALALLVHAPALFRGWQYDDYIHQYVLRHCMDLPGASPTRLYDFSYWTSAVAARDSGSLAAWWTSPEFKIRFFRPVTSLAIWLDYQVYDRWAPGYHITNLALFAAIVFLAWRLFVNLGASPRAASWALAFYAFTGSAALPVGWIANRNELCSSLFVVAMMLSFCRHRRLGGAHRLAASFVLFLLACLSKESGLIGLPLAGLCMLVLDPHPPGENFIRGCLRVLRSPALWIFVLITAAFLAYYVATGHGTTSANYATPGHRTGIYLGRLAALFPLSFGSLFFSLSTDMVFTREQLYWPVLTLDTILLVLLLRLLWTRLRKNPLAWFAAGWLVAALLPMAGVTLSDRLLMSAAVGSSLLLGLLLDSLGTREEILASPRLKFIAGVFIALGIIIPAPATLLRAGMFSGMAAADRDAILAADVKPATGPARQSVILLNSPSTLLALTMQPTWTVAKNDPHTTFHFLARARLPETILRESPDTLHVTYGDPLLLTHRYERIFHVGENPPPAGTAFTNADFIATVTATEGRGIRSVRFKFTRDLDTTPDRFLLWQTNAYIRATLPPVGQKLDLPAPIATVPWVP